MNYDEAIDTIAHVSDSLLNYWQKYQHYIPPDASEYYANQLKWALAELGKQDRLAPSTPMPAALQVPALQSLRDSIDEYLAVCATSQDAIV